MSIGKRNSKPRRRGPYKGQRWHKVHGKGVPKGQLVLIGRHHAVLLIDTHDAWGIMLAGHIETACVFGRRVAARRMAEENLERMDSALEALEAEKLLQLEQALEELNTMLEKLRPKTALDSVDELNREVSLEMDERALKEMA